MTQQGTTISATFDLERETKGAVRYQERGYDRETGDGMMGTLYVRKAVLGGVVPPVLAVTIDTAP